MAWLPRLASSFSAPKPASQAPRGNWWNATGFSLAKDEGNRAGATRQRSPHLARRGWDTEHPEAARIRPSSDLTAPPNGAISGHKPGAKRLAHANASQSPPSLRGVAIRGGGMPDPPFKNRKSKAACTIHRSSGSPGGGYPHPPLGDPASPRGGSAAYCTCTRAQGRFLRGMPHPPR
jgi:hypothetical protein